MLGEGGADWSRLQSLLRTSSGRMAAADCEPPGTDDPGLLGTVAVAGGSWSRLWRSRAAFDLKAAALAAGALLATPYVYMYDLAALAVAVAFLLRYALTRGFTTTDLVGLACGGALILSYPFVKTQVGLMAVLIVMALVVQRALADAHHERNFA